MVILMTDVTHERMTHTYYTLLALLRHLDQAQQDGEPRYENKGQLIKTAGQLRDEIGKRNVRDSVCVDEWFGQFEDTDD